MCYSVPMTNRERHRLEQRRSALIEELREIPNLMRGTLYERQRKCGRSSCTCASGGPRHPGLQLTVNMQGRTRTRFVRQAERAELQAWLDNYQRLWAIVEGLTEINLELLHAGERAA